MIWNDLLLSDKIKSHKIQDPSILFMIYYDMQELEALKLDEPKIWQQLLWLWIRINELNN